MIDLDVRLDSSLLDEDYGYLSRLQNLEKHTLSPLTLTNNRKDYLKAREEALELLQSTEAIEYAMDSLIHRLARHGYIYVEVGLTPILHTKGGLTIRRVVNAALTGMFKALEKCENIEANLILYCDRNASLADNTAVADIAMKNKGNKVVAVGLEGDDKDHPISEFQKLFRHIRKSEMPIVLELSNHYNNNASILRAIDMGVTRIISPYHIETNPEMNAKFFEKGITFEYRPTHDLINEYYKNNEELALKSLFAQGLPCFIAGCSYGICDASIINEGHRLINDFDFKVEELLRTFSASIYYSFATAHEKSQTVRRFGTQYPQFVGKFN